jgi:small redox-active disulfide protein 2
MKKIQILGMGCQKCNRLQELSEQAANELGVEYTVEKVKDMKRIMDFGVMVTPALVVDGEVKVAGKVPSLEDLKNLIK